MWTSHFNSILFLRESLGLFKTLLILRFVWLVLESLRSTNTISIRLINCRYHRSRRPLTESTRESRGRGHAASYLHGRSSQLSSLRRKRDEQIKRSHHLECEASRLRGVRRADRGQPVHRRHSLFQQVLASQCGPRDVTSATRRPDHAGVFAGLFGQWRPRVGQLGSLRLQYESKSAGQKRLHSYTCG